MNEHVSIGVVKRDISKLVNRVAYGGEQIVLTSRGLPKAVLVSVTDYEKIVAAQSSPRVAESTVAYQVHTPAVAHPYIDFDPTISGHKAIIRGTRIRVIQIAIEYERLHWTPDQIIDAHPHLALAAVHDALSYYYENQVSIDAEITANEAFVTQLRAQADALPD